MDFFWVFLFIFLVASVLLNVMGTNVISASHIHDERRKRVLMVILWGLPILGVFIVMGLINRDIKKNQAKMEEEIAPAIREVADRLKVLDADLSRTVSEDSLPNKNTKFH